MVSRVCRVVLFKNPLATSIKSFLDPRGTIRCSSIASTAVEERKVRVKDVEINYARTGSGEHPVLLLPGALGTIWTDFKPQIEGLDKNKLTIVAWDPPGYGKSRPPDRKYPDDFFDKDADYAHELMKVLGFPRFSLVGWSDGGITSLILAAKNPQSVRKMVVLGANAYILPHESKTYESIKNIDTWSERMKAPLMAIYGEDYFRKTWAAWVEAMINLFEKNNGDLCRDSVARIVCPTLIVHGKKDVMVDGEHAEYLKNNISNSQLEIFEKGSHNLHLRYHEEFNQLVTRFLLGNS
ncbi:valacyclovir hydrolase [Diachasma alloeum]|uniref:valacyclovir hydrolase n=1 Tax=Diachasma alloeum TaxID=454923 RepID=UPI000738384F|nr:valacyclovir hydrolase [Diachasma alloeum]